MKKLSLILLISFVGSFAVGLDECERTQGEQAIAFGGRCFNNVVDPKINQCATLMKDYRDMIAMMGAEWISVNNLNEMADACVGTSKTTSSTIYSSSFSCKINQEEARYVFLEKLQKEVREDVERAKLLKCSELVDSYTKTTLALGQGFLNNQALRTIAIDCVGDNKRDQDVFINRLQMRTEVLLQKQRSEESK